ncbi:MBL fold metallo-hydrolase [bacterium]|nr:MBL fold metallo-hydrolase [bacterium]
MRITFLGTAAAEGWPAVFCECSACQRARERGGRNIRTRTSALINDELLIDFPPDTFSHALNNGLFLSKVKYLLITHSHQDHFYPEDLAMRKPPFAHLESEKMLRIFANETVVERIKRYRLEGKETMIETKILHPFDEVEIEGYRVKALRADHQLGEECLIYLIKSEGKTILWGTDSGFFPEDTWDALLSERLGVAILDTTSGPHSTPSYHMGIPEVVKTKERMLKEGIADDKTIFISTHFSHNGGLLHEELERTLEPFGIMPAYDGFQIEI